MLPREVEAKWDDALISLELLLSLVRETGHSLYLLIDEYDNFANEVMTEIRGGTTMRW